MKLLFDQNLSFRIIKNLLELNIDCLHVSTCGLSNCNDIEIWKFAKNNFYTIVTCDSDFYDLSVINGHPPKIIWLRVGNISKNVIVQLIKNNSELINNFIHNEEFKHSSCLEIG